MAWPNLPSSSPQIHSQLEQFQRLSCFLFLLIRIFIFFSKKQISLYFLSSKQLQVDRRSLTNGKLTDEGLETNAEWLRICRWSSMGRSGRESCGNPRIEKGKSVREAFQILDIWSVNEKRCYFLLGSCLARGQASCVFGEIEEGAKHSGVDQQSFLRPCGTVPSRSVAPNGHRQSLLLANWAKK